MPARPEGGTTLSSERERQAARELEICRVWASHCTNETLAQQLRKMSEDPFGWSKPQRTALFEEVAMRIESFRWVNGLPVTT